MSIIDSSNLHKDENNENDDASGIKITNYLKVLKGSLLKNEDTNGDNSLKISCFPSINNDEVISSEDAHKKRKNNNIQYSKIISSSVKDIPFPVQLHRLLTYSDHVNSKVIQWCLHGRAFKVHNIQKFEVEVLPKYFGHADINTFRQQLKSHGFRRLTFAQDYGAYYHALLIRGRSDICGGIDPWERKVPFLCEINLYRLPYIDSDGKEISIATYSHIMEQEKQKRIKLHKNDKNVQSKRTSLIPKNASSKEIDEALAIKHGILPMSDHPLDRIPFFLPLCYFCD